MLPYGKETLRDNAGFLFGLLVDVRVLGSHLVHNLDQPHNRGLAITFHLKVKRLHLILFQWGKVGIGREQII